MNAVLVIGGGLLLMVGLLRVATWGFDVAQETAAHIRANPPITRKDWLLGLGFMMSIPAVILGVAALWAA